MSLSSDRLQIVKRVTSHLATRRRFVLCSFQQEVYAMPQQTPDDQPPPRLTASQKRDLELRSLSVSYRDPARKRRVHRHIVVESRRLSNSAKQVSREPPEHAVPGAPDEEAPDQDGGAQTLRYPRHARLGLMFMALQSSVARVAKQYGIPSETLYSWFREEGGIQEIREYVASSAGVAFQRLVQLTCDELALRLKDSSSEELFSSFRKMLEVGERTGLVKAGSRGVGGGAVESESSPEHPPRSPQIVLQIVPPTPMLPPGSGSQGNALQQPAQDAAPGQDAIIDGEVTDVFED